MQHDSATVMTPRQMTELAAMVAAELSQTVRAELNKAPLLLSREQLAQRLGVSAATIDRHTRAGKIPSLKLGGQVRYDIAEVLAAMRPKPRISFPSSEESQQP